MKKPAPNAAKNSNLVEIEDHVLHELIRERNTALKKFPFLFALLGSFGLVATFYGFEHLIDQSEFLVENPLILLIIGITCLALTGSLYKKLG